MNQESAPEPKAPIAEIREILEMLPHRYPFMLVDRVTEIVPGERIAGYKNVTYNEPFFQGHFPGSPIMPGVLQIEALAQLSGLLLLQKPEDRGSLAYFMAIDKARFRKPVFPGDRLDLLGTVLKMKLRLLKVHGQAFVDGVLVSEGELMFQILPRSEML
jgi:3-hydroxyacyl-[acyl-carrier-protein] dehydratase